MYTYHNGPEDRTSGSSEYEYIKFKGMQYIDSSKTATLFALHWEVGESR